MNTTKLNKRVIGSKKQRGQGMTEYIIIVALIAIAAIAVFSAFGGTIKGEIAQITGGLTGEQTKIDAGKTRSEAGSAAAGASAAKKNNMQKYAEDAAKEQ
jgi:Flp pilus assembly pilin Flp